MADEQVAVQTIWMLHQGPANLTRLQRHGVDALFLVVRGRCLEKYAKPPYFLWQIPARFAFSTSSLKGVWNGFRIKHHFYLIPSACPQNIKTDSSPGEDGSLKF
jgi:hypothetical protein